MAGSLVKKVMLKIVADDGDSEAKLDKISAKAGELARLHPDLKVKVDSAAASAKLAVLRRELKDTSKDAGDGPGLRGRLMGLSGGAMAITGLGDAMGAFSKDASMGARVMSGFSLATGLLEAPMSGLIVGVGGLAAGFASAGIGAGVFGLVAKSAISNVTPAVTAYETALNTTGKAQKTAMTQYKQYMGALSGPQREMAHSLIGAEGAWNKFVSSNTSGVAKIVSQGVGLLPKLFASMQPFMAPVEHALHGIIGELGKGLGSSGFKSFIDSMAKDSGPMLTNLAGAIGHVVVGIGGILKAFLPMAGTMTGGLDRLTAKFAHWGTTLTSHSGFQALVAMAKQDMPYVISIVKNLVGAIKNLGGSMTGLSSFSNSKALLQLATPLSQLVNWLSKANPALLRTGLYMLAAGGAAKKLSPAISGIKGGIDLIKGGASAAQDLRSGLSNSAAAASSATGAWGTFGGGISKAVTAVKGWGIWSKIASGATKVWTGVQAAFNLVMDMNPVMLVVIGIGLLAAAIVLLIVKCKPFREFWIHMWHDVTHIVSVAVNWIKSHWKLLATILAGIVAGPFGAIVVGMATHFGTIRHDAAKAFDAVRHSASSMFDSLRHDTAAGMDKVKSLAGDGLHWLHSHFTTQWNAIARVVRTAFNLIKGIFDVAIEVLTGHWSQAGTRLVHLTTFAFTAVRHAISSLTHDFGSLLLSAGKNLVMGLVHGIEAVAMAPVHAVESIVGDVRNLLPFSPAKKGPLSGSGSPDLAGRKIGLMLAGGIRGTSPVVAAAATRMAASAAVHGGAGRPGGGAGGEIVLRIEGSDQSLVNALVLALRKDIRVKGGNVQTVLGH